MSNIFVWKPELSVNIVSIDSQHKNLLAIGGDLYDAISSGRGRVVCGKTLDRLVRCAGTHFAYEERLMLSHGYPDFEAHKAEHNALNKKVTQFQEDFNSGSAEISIERLTFLKDWLDGHIQNSDSKYAPFVCEKPAA